MGFNMIAFVVIIAALIQIQAKSLAPRLPVLDQSSKLPPQSIQKGYATKEVIVYLTPSQIRALQNGQGLINPPRIPYVDSVKNTETHNHDQPQALSAQPDQNDYRQPHLTHPTPMKAPPIDSAQSGQLISGLEVLNNSSKFPPQSTPKKYATKEIILYLTPSQIRSLQENQGLISPSFTPPEDGNKHTQAYIRGTSQNLPIHRDQNNHQLRHLASETPRKATSTKQPNSDQFVPIVPPPEYGQTDNYAFINSYRENQSRSLKPIPPVTEPSEETDLEHKELPTLIPNGPTNEKDKDDQLSHDQIKENFFRVLDQNRDNFKVLAELSQYQIVKSNEHKYPISQYDQKHALAIENLIQNNHLRQLQNLHAQLQAEAIAKSPPVAVHEEVNIKHSPVLVFNRIPVPTPVSIPVPKPFEVKVPQPYRFQ